MVQDNETPPSITPEENHSENAIDDGPTLIDIPLEGPRGHTIAPFEVVVHNTSDDCWVSFLGKVYDITPVLNKFEGQACVGPLLVNAGKDISQWFDERTGDIQMHVHPITGAVVPYCPNGPIPDVGTNYPLTTWEPIKGKPWWKDETLCIYKGPLTKRVRPIRIINTLNCTEVALNVCSEDTIREIAMRYSIFCDNVDNYTWRIVDRELKLDRTLEENGVFDDREQFAEHAVPYPSTPAIFICFNDDMKFEEAEFDAGVYHIIKDEEEVSYPEPIKFCIRGSELRVSSYFSL